MPRNLRSMIVNSLFKEFVTNDEKSFAKDLYLSYEEIHEMREYGMYFGSHGYSHEWLGTISPSELNFEIEESRKFYSRINGNNDHMIMCYPYGSYSAEVIQKLKESEYKVGLTIEVGDAVLNKLNAFTLKRYDTNDFQQ
ncbi:MAG: hypothetical protein E6L00_08330 [Thaumarchaeota archaeon]|nr:MAG: hypothetical protein E6L00_08330 [Nitrososphaerota archaeon]